MAPATTGVRPERVVVSGGGDAPGTPPGRRCRCRTGHRCRRTRGGRGWLSPVSSPGGRGRSAARAPSLNPVTKSWRSCSRSSTSVSSRLESSSSYFRRPSTSNTCRPILRSQNTVRPPSVSPNWVWGRPRPRPIRKTRASDSSHIAARAATRSLRVTPRRSAWSQAAIAVDLPSSHVHESAAGVRDTHALDERRRVVTEDVRARQDQTCGPDVQQGGRPRKVSSASHVARSAYTPGRSCTRSPRFSGVGCRGHRGRAQARSAGSAGRDGRASGRARAACGHAAPVGRPARPC